LEAGFLHCPQFLLTAWWPNIKGRSLAGGGCPGELLNATGPGLLLAATDPFGLAVSEERICHLLAGLFFLCKKKGHVVIYLGIYSLTFSCLNLIFCLEFKLENRLTL
jgi:hypothetical protein